MNFFERLKFLMFGDKTKTGKVSFVADNYNENAVAKKDANADSTPILATRKTNLSFCADTYRPELRAGSHMRTFKRKSAKEDNAWLDSFSDDLDRLSYDRSEGRGGTMR